MDEAIVVTGASGGVGSKAVEILADRGADVAVQYRSSADAAEAAARKARDAGVDAVPLQADLSDPDAAQKLVDAADDAIGPLTGGVLLAGYPWRRDLWFDDFADLDPDQLRAPIDVDLLGSARLCQALCPRLAETGGGAVVLTASTPALTGDVEGVPYTLAKAGIVALAKSLARTYGPDGVRVNALALGSIRTGPMTDLTDEEEAPLVEETALQRLGEPREAAEAAAFLVGEDASYVNGETLVVDGGASFR